MTRHMQLVLATTNAHKATELQTLLADAGFEYEVLTLDDVGFHDVIDETGLTFEDNAFIKASAVHLATGLPVLADDSGLQVVLLDGLPGVRSARYAGENSTDADNRAKLRAELAARNASSSPAAFRCVVCYIDETRTLLAEGISNGVIIQEERGRNGFGYDAMFIPEGYDATYGELTPSEKNTTSHRSRAMTSLIQQLTNSTHISDDVDRRHLRQLYIDVAIAVIDAPQDVERLLSKVPTSCHHEAYEIMLQSYLFGGFPAALDALQSCYRVFGAPPLIGEVGTQVSDVRIRERGEVLCREIYGSVYEKMIDTLTGVSPDLAQWMITEGYGKTLFRPGCDTVTRELCIVAMLTVLGRRQQLTSHVRGALRAGATIQDLKEVEHAVTERCGTKRSDLLLELILLQERRLTDG